MRTLFERIAVVVMTILAAIIIVLTGQYVHLYTQVVTSKTELKASTAALVKAKVLLSEVFAQPVDTLDRFSTPVAVTAYTARAEECDDTPETTADNTPSRVGIIAMSHDLFRDMNLTFGDRVMVEVAGKNLGVFEIRDSMNRRWTRRVDILHGNLAAARLFGHNEDGRLIWVR